MDKDAREETVVVGGRNACLRAGHHIAVDGGALRDANTQTTPCAHATVTRSRVGAWRMARGPLTAALSHSMSHVEVYGVLLPESKAGGTFHCEVVGAPIAL